MLNRTVAGMSAAVAVAALTAGAAWGWRTSAGPDAAGQQALTSAPMLSDGATMLQACVDAEAQRGGDSAVVSRSGWTVVEARQLEGLRSRQNLGTRADPRPVLVPAPPRYLVAGYTPEGDATAVCVMGGAPATGYGMLWASLGPTGVPSGHVSAPVSASGVLGAEYDSVVYGWYAAGVTDIAAKVDGRLLQVAARDGFWSATVRNPAEPDAGSIPSLQGLGAVEVSGTRADGAVAQSSRFAAEIVRDKPCWVAAPTVDSRCGQALPIN